MKAKLESIRAVVDYFHMISASGGISRWDEAEKEKYYGLLGDIKETLSPIEQEIFFEVYLRKSKRCSDYFETMKPYQYYKIIWSLSLKMTAFCKMWKL